MFWLESLHGITLDVDRSSKDIEARHRQHSKNPARIFFIENGKKSFVKEVN
jgi:hypothetical protein